MWFSQSESVRDKSKILHRAYAVRPKPEISQTWNEA